VRDPLKFYGFCVICVEKEVNIQIKQELRRKKKKRNKRKRIQIEIEVDNLEKIDQKASLNFL